MKLKVLLAGSAFALACALAAQTPAPATMPPVANPASPPAAPADAGTADAGASQAAAAAGDLAGSGPQSALSSASAVFAPAAPTAEALAAARGGRAQLLAAKAGDAEAGATKSATCGACHGVDGNSAVAQYPKLAGQSEWFTARQLMLFKTGVRQNAVMMPFAAPLSAQDMRDIGAYFATQSLLAGTADEGLIDAPGPHLGKKLYVVGEQLYRGGDGARGIPACMACHGPTGAGNPGSAFPRLAGQHAAYTQNLLERYRAGETHGDARDDPNAPIMPTIARELTDLEIGALATYIEGLHPFDPNAVMAALTPTASSSKEPAIQSAESPTPGAATQDAAAAPGPAGPVSPNATPQPPADSDSGDIATDEVN